MANEISNIITGIAQGSGNVFMWALVIIGVVLTLTAIGGGLFAWWWHKRGYFLKAEIKLIRNDGKQVISEWGSAKYNAKKGVLFIKRKKMRAIPVKILDISRYIQGADTITVIQLSPLDYRPVLPESFTEFVTEYQDEKTGEIVKIKESVLNIKTETGENKAWESAYTNASKRAYSIQSFFQQFAVPTTVAIVIVAIFIGFSLIWIRLPTICK